MFRVDRNAVSKTIPEIEYYTIFNNSATTLGPHTVTVSLNDSTNYEWDNGYSDDLEYELYIYPMRVDKPAIYQYEFIYDGFEHHLDIDESEYYTVHNNSLTEIGSVSVEVELINEYYEWSDGTSENLVFTLRVREEYTENNAAHHFELKLIGGGYAYHSVFRNKNLTISDYDALWPGYIAQEHDEDSALRLAYCRLCFPVQLSKQALARYADYLRVNMKRALSLALRERDIGGLRMLLALDGFDKEALDAALMESRTLQITEATAILLEKSHTILAAGRSRSFEL